MYLYGKLKHTVWSVFVSDENLTEMFETSYRNRDVVFFKILFDYLFIFQWEWISLTQLQLWSRCACSCVSSFTFTYPSTARIVGTSQMPSQPVSSIFPCSPLPSGTWRTPGLSIPWCCLPTPFPVCLVFPPPPHNCTLQDGFGQTWWKRDVSIALKSVPASCKLW